MTDGAALALQVPQEIVEALARRLPRVALRCPGEAADALGVSPDYFDEHIRPELRLIRRGRIVLVSIRELERWAEASASRTLEG